MTHEKEKKIEIERTEKIWNESEVELLKKWGESAASYRFLHDRAFRIFLFRNYCFSIPVIVLSTISGTASFSVNSFPVAFQEFVPMVIGGVNIFVGIIQTIAQFLRISELSESHRVASISYGKFCRNITTELSLPPQNRSYSGIDFVQMCRTEFDRLLEQSPIIPMRLLHDFDKNPDFQNITKPDVLKIMKINEYRPSKDERISNIVTDAAEKFKMKMQLAKGSEKKNAVNSITDKFEKNIHASIPEQKDSIMNNVELGKNKLLFGKETRKVELSEIQGNKIVSNILKKGENTGTSFMNNLNNMIKSVTPKKSNEKLNQLKEEVLVSPNIPELNIDIPENIGIEIVSNDDKV